MMHRTYGRRGAAAYFLLGLVIGALLLPLCVYLYFWSGKAPISAFDSELPFEDIVTRQALEAKFARIPKAPSPVAATSTNLEDGARIYTRQCATCHGLPTGPVSRIATGMFPPPPQFFHSSGLATQNIDEIYWKTANGIRLTGMPAFRGSLSDREIWEVSQLLKEAGNLPDPLRRQLGPRQDTVPGQQLAHDAQTSMTGARR